MKDQNTTPAGHTRRWAKVRQALLKEL